MSFMIVFLVQLVWPCQCFGVFACVCARVCVCMSVCVPGCQSMQAPRYWCVYLCRSTRLAWCQAFGLFMARCQNACKYVNILQGANLHRKASEERLSSGSGVAGQQSFLTRQRQAHTRRPLPTPVGSTGSISAGSNTPRWKCPPDLATLHRRIAISSNIWQLIMELHDDWLYEDLVMVTVINQRTPFYGLIRLNRIVRCCTSCFFRLLHRVHPSCGSLTASILIVNRQMSKSNPMIF